VVEISDTVFVCPVAALAEETWLAWPSTTRILDYHGLSEVFVELER